MPRKKRPLDRDAGVLRDASLVVIASEDTYAVKDYFSRFKTRRLQFVVVPTEDGRSAPGAVIARLDEYKNREATEDNDQFWLCIDKDHWAESGHIANLVEVLQHCKHRGEDDDRHGQRHARGQPAPASGRRSRAYPLQAAPRPGLPVRCRRRYGSPWIHP